MLGAQGAFAQTLNGCPAGQVIQASDSSGRHLVCVPLPDVGAEAAARASADAALLGAINDETSNAGRYTFSGTQTCLSSTFGFNADLTPRASPDPARAAVVSQNAGFTTGLRTFNADGTGTSELTTTMRASWSRPAPSSGIERTLRKL